MHRLPLYAVEAIVLLTTLAVLLRARLPRQVVWGVSAFGAVVFVGYAIFDGVHSARYGKFGVDLAIFRDAGAAWLAGEDPYAAPLFVHPPSVLPFFAPLAWVPLVPLRIAFAVFNAVAILILPWLSRRALAAQGETDQFAPETLALLGVTVALSFASRYGLDLGQLAALGAVALCAALIAQGRNQPTKAGLWLVLAHLKIGTMLPFLLLFLRRRDVRAWLVLVGAGILLAVVGSLPRDPVTQCRHCLANIGRQGDVGVNNVTFSNSSSAQILAFDHTLYRLGVRDLRAAKVGQFVLLAALGGWLLWLIVREKISRGAACAMVATFSMLFLYHRNYDLILLALPLTFAAGRATQGGPRRWWHVAAALAALAVMYLPVGPLQALTTKFADRTDIVARLVQAIVLPCGVWLVLAVLLCLWLGERASRMQPVVGPVRTR